MKALYKIILGLPLTYHDVEDFDNDLYRNLKWCLEHSVVGLGLAFTETQDFFGESKEVEIVPGGLNIEVTEDNKYEYVQKMALHKLYNSIQRQVDAFLTGFYEVVPKPLVEIFDNRELELLISGLPNIDSKAFPLISAYSYGPAREHRVPELFGRVTSRQMAL